MVDQIYKADPIIIKDVNKYLENHQNKSLLRFITCGSVDDGKSTLIGRLLYDSKMIYRDQIEQLEEDSKKAGSSEKELNFSLLVDGLAVEREQGITIDVAYRFFTTDKRKFIVADTPGHEQYTRNMVTGASTADLAVILIDARKGVLDQTRRHSYLCHLLGIKRFVLAVNKIDLVDYDQKIFDNIVTDYSKFSNTIKIKDFIAIPISAANGDNITSRSRNTSWHNGQTLMEYLESIDVDNVSQNEQDFCMPVQWVNHPDSEFRGLSGKVVAGTIRPGDEVNILPFGSTSQVDRIVTFDGDLKSASAGQSVTITLKTEVDCSRGQVITIDGAFLEVANQFEATLIWLHEDTLIPGRSYYLKIGTQTVSATVAEPKFRVNVNTMDHVAAKTLQLNEIGVSNITTESSIPFTSYVNNRSLGGFILIDKITNATVGAGLINFALRRAQNIHWQKMDITREHHANLKSQKAAVIWMTGLSGSGKSTIANAVEKKLASMLHHTFLLDGDNLRHGLNKDLGFTDADRIENIRRVGEVSKLMADAGLIVITAFISPFQSERMMVRDMMAPGEFIEIFIDTPLEVAEQRDVKGLYAKARLGQLKNFTGIDSIYEEPTNPDVHIDTTSMTADQAAEKIVKYLLKNHL